MECQPWHSQTHRCPAYDKRNFSVLIKGLFKGLLEGMHNSSSIPTTLQQHSNYNIPAALRQQHRTLYKLFIPEQRPLNGMCKVIAIPTIVQQAVTIPTVIRFSSQLTGLMTDNVSFAVLRSQRQECP